MKAMIVIAFVDVRSWQVGRLNGRENGGDGWTLNDAIFRDMRSMAGKIYGGIYAE